MKNFILHINLILLFAGIVVSCSNEQQSILDIKHTEKLLETRPDSALKLLKQIDPKVLSTSEYARYCLLMTEALGKNQIPITSDSLISVAVEYFNDKSDKDIKAKTYFYAGWVNQEMQNTKQAMEYFLKAADFAEGDKDYKLQYLIYFYLGDLYFQENLYDSALKMNKQAFKFSKLLGNKNYMVYALRSTALAYSGKGQKDSSIVYYSKAIDLLPKSDSVTLATLYNEIGDRYNDIKKFKQAIQYVDKAISLNPSSEELHYFYVVKAHIYYSSAQYDSAYYYYSKTVESPNLNTKVDSYLKLSNIERKRGNLKKAFEYTDIFLHNKDLIEEQSHSEMIIKMQNIYQHKKTVEKSSI
ncbi:tetratricopeptide repeat protein [Bacteroides sedimenti]|uniref:Tetratricopeptide repeat protein n=1 Tax=Bacteroides sedimenti TaxID=2136147 RepID=A0ABM8IE47_9BACE